MEQMKGCYVPNCWGERKSRGLCGAHYQEQKQQGKHHFYSNLFDLDQTHRKPLSYWKYKTRVETLARSIPVDTRLQRHFTNLMITEYRKTTPPRSTGGSQ
jgi:hypothetical protein